MVTTSDPADPGYDARARADESPLLATTLDLLVPLAILELHGQGGPTPADVARVQARLSDSAARADVLLYGGGKRGEAGKLAAWLAESIAVLAFCPGGVTLFGRHWEALPAARFPHSPPALPSWPLLPRPPRVGRLVL